MRTVKSVIRTSNLTWDEIDVRTLSRYVAVTTEWQEIVNDKLDECTPRPKAQTTFNSWVNPSGTARDTDGDSQFSPPVREPSAKEVKKLLHQTTRCSSTRHQMSHH